MTKEPTAQQAAVCLQIRKRAKRGGQLTATESALCRRMFQQFPDWYARTDSVVFEETKPFGAG